MTGTQLTTEIRRYTGTTSTTLSDTTLLPIVNNVKDEFGVAIEGRNEQYFMMTSLFDLVASTFANREYSFPDDMLSKMVALHLGFTSSLKYRVAQPYPGGYQRLIRQLGEMTESNIAGSFSNDEPFYYLTRKGVYILSATISAVTNGGRLLYKAFPADLANLTGSTGLHIDPTTTTFGIPIQFHELWARKVSINWKSQRTKPIPLSPLEQRYELDLEKALASIASDDAGGELLSPIPRTTGEDL